jgi:hypothetical protein
MTTVLALFMGACIFPSAAVAQNLGEFVRCRAVSDATVRLRCYDALVPKNISAPASGKYANISLTDLKLDRANMRGQKIETSGILQVMGDMVLLKGDAMDMSPIFVDITRVSREVRQLALDFKMGCRETDSGVERPVLMQPGIIAESLGQP